MTTYTLRPLADWTGPETPPDRRRGAHVFKASWASTLELLGHELEHLAAENVVLQVDVREGDLRVDGMLRANAKVGHRGVRVSFDSKHGPLTYATDVYERFYVWSTHHGWQANVRAIALALEALRAVDRHGVSRTGEQYRGWRAIEAGTAASATFATAEEAARWLAGRFVADDDGDAQAIAGRFLAGGPPAKALYLRMVKDLHPDRGGEPEDWARLDAAWRLIGGAR